MIPPLRSPAAHGAVRIRLAAAAASVALLAGCAAKEEVPSAEAVESPPPVRIEDAPPEVAKPREAHDGKYYKDDGPPDVDEVDWRTVPEPTPEFEPIRPGYNRPYEVFGVRYLPFTDYTPYRRRGMASWYGKRYHGNKTSSGEVYNMYDMTAAHTVLPIPSYARVTRVDDGRSIVVRVNDRGPFLNERIIDLSYTAARKLGIVATGTGEVIVEAILPGEGDVRLASFKAKADSGKAGGEERERAVEVSGEYFLQLGAFSDAGNADGFASSVELPAGMHIDSLTVRRGELNRVLIGPYQSKFQAEGDLGRLHDAGLEALLKIF